MPPTHTYRTTTRWTGNLGTGTRDYRGYSRDHTLEAEGKPSLPGTSSTGYGMDPARYNPEELLVGALSSCHMLWYLHLCAEAGVAVVAYEDPAEGTLELSKERGGRMVRATLRPHVRVGEGSLERARELHEEAHRRCYLANSVNFPVVVEPVVEPAA